MKSLYTQGVLASTVIGTALSGAPALAQPQAPNPFGTTGQAQNQLATVKGSSGLGGGDLPAIIGTIINVVLGFMGIVLLFYIILAGMEWMSAGGEKGGVETAKARIKNAVTGLVIIVSAYAISSFVITQLANLTK